ncbi:hypothetical protein [Pseudobacter ginsenosidimutans]|uniref:Type IX secretion system PorP/SprF family membrane protein n=1 Tax=Pseudobacter ginsenosidimutans TaxID=661488 RepID=A0A4Q7MKR1_9BACT|nr:hypothetical protein [Pseudobacter ginsenosidimutans]QEC40467.1 hypothetical protein FSB84_01670 [Pseudobacter ginsenosidimutans]RZS68925.1 hypothetical protein EV199_4749 [Pseudobacter ginsenosidimutans]
MKTLLWGLLCTLSVRSVAQIIRPAALQPMHAAAYNQQFADIFSSKINPAALAGITQFHSGAWVEKKFLLEELRQYSIVTGAPAAGGGWAFSMDYSGLPVYHQWQGCLAFGKKLGKISMGAQMNYTAQSTDGYGNKGWLSAGIGAIWQLSSALSAGWQLYHLSGKLLGAGQGERVAYGYSAGLGFLLAPSILMEGSFLKYETQPASFQAAIHYKADHHLMASCFLELTDTRPSVRVKWQAGIFQVGVTGSYHALLGFSPGLLLIVSGTQKGGL